MTTNFKLVPGSDCSVGNITYYKQQSTCRSWDGLFVECTFRVFPSAIKTCCHPSLARHALSIEVTSLRCWDNGVCWTVSARQNVCVSELPFAATLLVCTSIFINSLIPILVHKNEFEMVKCVICVVFSLSTNYQAIMAYLIFPELMCKWFKFKKKAIRQTL